MTWSDAFCVMRGLQAATIVTGAVPVSVNVRGLHQEDYMMTPLMPRTGAGFIAPDIHIERMNTDKTRKVIGSGVDYQIFFDLSSTPAPEWRTIFFHEWKESGSAHHTELDGPFLVVHCPLTAMTPVELAKLEQTVATANEAYHCFAQGEVTEVARREQEWKQERNAVEAVASALHFGEPATAHRAEG